MINKDIVVMCDLDDVVFPLIKTLIPLYNKLYEDNVKVSDIKDWNIHNFLKPECKNVFKLVDENFFKGMEIDYITEQALTEMNHRFMLYFATSGHPKTMPWRDRLLSEYLPWYSSDQLIRCANKSLISCDYIIDDNIDNIIGNMAHQYSHGIIRNQPWNRAFNTDLIQVDRCDDLFEALVHIEAEETRKNLEEGR